MTNIDKATHVLAQTLKQHPVAGCTGEYEGVTVRELAQALELARLLVPEPPHPLPFAHYVAAVESSYSGTRILCSCGKLTRLSPELVLPFQCPDAEDDCGG